MKMKLPWLLLLVQTILLAPVYSLNAQQFSLLDHNGIQMITGIKANLQSGEDISMWVKEKIGEDYLLVGIWERNKRNNKAEKIAVITAKDLKSFRFKNQNDLDKFDLVYETNKTINPSLYREHDSDFVSAFYRSYKDFEIRQFIDFFTTVGYYNKTAVSSRIDVFQIASIYDTLKPRATFDDYIYLCRKDTSMKYRPLIAKDALEMVNSYDRAITWAAHFNSHEDESLKAADVGLYYSNSISDCINLAIAFPNNERIQYRCRVKALGRMRNCNDANVFLSSFGTYNIFSQNFLQAVQQNFSSLEKDYFVNKFEREYCNFYVPAQKTAEDYYFIPANKSTVLTFKGKTASLQIEGVSKYQKMDINQLASAVVLANSKRIDEVQTLGEALGEALVQSKMSKVHDLQYSNYEVYLIEPSSAERLIKITFTNNSYSKNLPFSFHSFQSNSYDNVSVDSGEMSVKLLQLLTNRKHRLVEFFRMDSNETGKTTIQAAKDLICDLLAENSLINYTERDRLKNNVFKYIR